MVVRDVSLDSDDTVYPALTALIARTLEETGLVEDMAQALGYNPALTLHLLNAAVGSTASSLLTLKVVESPHESSLEMSFPIKIP